MLFALEQQDQWALLFFQKDLEILKCIIWEDINKKLFKNFEPQF